MLQMLITDILKSIALKSFHNKNLGDYHGLCVQSDKILLADILEKFRDKCV